MEQQATPNPRREYEIHYMSIDRLLLDPDNPRLSLDDEHRAQFDIVKVLYNEMAIDELVMSIAENGYFPEEPLFVIPETPGAREDDPNTRYVIIEGNRRLAAVLLLLNDKWRAELRATDLPEPTPERRAELQELPVSVYHDRQNLWTYLSFRHINSPKAWDSFSKARYVARVHDDYGQPLGEIARKIGDQHSTVARLYRGYKVLQQAERETDFEQEDRYRNRFYFSHLYTGLDYEEFQSFLGIENPEQFEAEDPVPKERLWSLELLMTWLYGRRSKGIEPLVHKQNPDLGRLRDALSTPESVEALMSGCSLSKAYETSVGDGPRFRRALEEADERLDTAQRLVATGYDGNPTLYEILGRIHGNVNLIDHEMTEKYETAEKQALDAED